MVVFKQVKGLAPLISMQNSMRVKMNDNAC